MSEEAASLLGEAEEEGNEAEPSKPPFEPAPQGVCGHISKRLHAMRVFVDVFTIRLLVIIVGVQWMLKGFCMKLSGAADPYLFRSIGQVSASQMQIYLAVIALPWALKPLMGVISDLLPLAGYHKKYYMVLSNSVAVGCAVNITFSWPLSVKGMVICSLLINFNTALCDLLLEATYSAKIKQAPDQGPALISYIVAGQAVLSVASALSSGYIIELAGAQWNYLVVLIVGVLLMYPLLDNYAGDKKISEAEHRIGCWEGARVRVAKGDQWKLVLMAIIAGALAVGFSVVGFTGGTRVRLIYALTSSALLMLAVQQLLAPLLFRVICYSFVSALLSPAIGSATYYFSTDTFAQFPEGPHFKPEFYVTAVGAISSCVQLASVLIYKSCLSEWRYRSLFCMSSILSSLLTATNVVFYLRRNAAWGVPDSWFVLTEDAVAALLGTWNWLPSFLLLSQLVEEGSEASIFSLVAGISNLGNTVSAFLGGALLHWMHVEPSGAPHESAQFSHLWQVSLISSLLPLLSLPMIFWAVPDCSQVEDVQAAFAKKKASL